MSAKVHVHEPGSFRELWSVALPLMLSSGSLSLQFVIDRIFLTWYSKEALAASMPAGMLHWTVVSIGIGTASYVNTFVAQYHGAGHRDRISAVLWQGIYFAILAALVIAGLIPFADEIFRVINHDSSIQQLEIDYFNVLNAGAFPGILAATLACFFSGRGQTRIILWVNVAATCTNAFFDYFFIFGIGSWSGMGIRGAALATVLSSVAAASIYVGVLCFGEEGKRHEFLRYWRFERELFARLMRFGLPSGFHFFLDVVCFSFFILLVGRLGTDDLAATSLAFNLNTLAFVPLFGLGTAVMTLVGQRVGEGRPELAVQTTWIAFLISFIHMSVFGVIYLAAPDLILMPYAAYTDRAEFEAIRTTVVVLLRFVAVYGIFDAMNIVFGAAVRGAGDTKFSMIFSGTCGWFLMVVPTYIALVHFNGGLVSAWTTITCLLVVLGFGYMARFQQGKWKTMRVIEDNLVSSVAADLGAAPIPIPLTDGEADEKTMECSIR